MSVEFIDGPTVIGFINDSRSFAKWTAEKFKSLDSDGDGVISRHEIHKRPGKLSSSIGLELQSEDEISGLYDIVFEKFDKDRSGNITPEKFDLLMKEIMLAKARGIGDSPICIILQEDSLLMRAVQHAES